MAYKPREQRDNSHLNIFYRRNGFGRGFNSFSLFLFFTTLFAFGLGLVIPTSSIAIHKGAGGLVCGQCHTMHNSQGAAELGGAAGGSLLLLRANVSSRENIHKLCLQCHASNGPLASTAHVPQNVMAPKVYSSASWTMNDPFNLIGSGGNFSSELDSSWNVTTDFALGYGHSLGATNVTPPGGDEIIGAFSCTNCHDPHGTSEPNSTTINMYRNLRVSALGAGSNSTIQFRNYTHTTVDRGRWTGSYVGSLSAGESNGSYFGGTELDNAGQVIWPIFTTKWGALTGNPSSDNGKTNYYSGVQDSGVDGNYYGMGKWCAQCHDNWHERIDTTNKVYDWSAPDPWDYRYWKRHPVNAPVPRNAVPRSDGSGCANGCHGSFLDRSNYTTDLIMQGKAIPVTAIQNGFYTNGQVYYLPNCNEYPGWSCPTSDEGTMADWPNNTAPPRVFCLTCHFAHGGPYYDALRWGYTSMVTSGDQTGNPIPAKVGCQLCHNR